MASYALIWTMIIISAALSYLFKIVPFIFKKRLSENSSKSLSNFFDYVSSAVIGCIIYTVAFDEKLPMVNTAFIHPIMLIKIAIIFIAFYLSLKLGNLTLCFLVNFILYGTTLFLLGGSLS